MESLKNSAIELHQNQRTWRTGREVAEYREGSGGNGDNTKRMVGKERIHLRVGGLQGELGEINQLEMQEEAGRWRQGMAKRLEETTEKGGREHLPPHSGSQGEGDC